MSSSVLRMPGAYAYRRHCLGATTIHAVIPIPEMTALVRGVLGRPTGGSFFWRESYEQAGRRWRITAVAPMSPQRL